MSPSPNSMMNSEQMNGRVPDFNPMMLKLAAQQSIPASKNPAMAPPNQAIHQTDFKKSLFLGHQFAMNNNTQ